MAFSTTVLAWGILIYEQTYKETGWRLRNNRKSFGRRYVFVSGEYETAVDAVKWATDYFLKCHVSKNEFYGQVGDFYIDHKYWGRPEEMNMTRPAYKIDPEHPGNLNAATNKNKTRSIRFCFSEQRRFGSGGGNVGSFSGGQLDFFKRKRHVFPAASSTRRRIVRFRTETPGLLLQEHARLQELLRVSVFAFICFITRKITSLLVNYSLNAFITHRITHYLQKFVHLLKNNFISFVKLLYYSRNHSITHDILSLLVIYLYYSRNHLLFYRKSFITRRITFKTRKIILLLTKSFTRSQKVDRCS